MAIITEPRKPIDSACSAPRPSTGLPRDSHSACEAALYSSVRPSQTKPMCSLSLIHIPEPTKPY